MIIEMMLEGLYNLMSLLLVFNIPELPTQVNEYVEAGFEYITVGGGLLANYVPLPYLFILFELIIAVDLAIMTYHFIMWVLKKIPVFGVQ